MNVVIHLVLLSIILFFTANISHAGPCDSILIGIYDSKIINSGSISSSSMLRIIDKAEASSYEQASKTALDAGFTLPDVPTPLKFGVSSDSSGKGNWSSKFRDYLKSNSSFQQHYQANFQSANQGVVDAWRQCVVERTGIKLEVEETSDDTEILLLLGWKSPDAEAVQAPRIKSIEISNNKVELITPTENFVGQRASVGQPMPITLRRLKGYSGEVSISIFTDNKNYSHRVRIRALPQPFPSPSPAIAKNSPDFDGDRRRDAFEVSGTTIITRLAGLTLERQTPLPTDYNTNIGAWLAGDFNGDECSDLIHIVTEGVVDPHYAHVYLSRCDGTFALPNKFRFNAPGIANPQGDYNTKVGSWDIDDCSTGRRTVLKHDPNFPDRRIHYWTPVGDGRQFRISTNSCNP